MEEYEGSGKKAVERELALEGQQLSAHRTRPAGRQEMPYCEQGIFRPSKNHIKSLLLGAVNAYSP